MTEKKFENSGASLYYRVYGEGRPVLLIHGFGEDSNIWENMIADLDNRYQLIVPDLPGSGRSGLPAETVSIETLAEGIKALMDQEKIDSCSMVGHSMGGYITLAFAEKYPERLTSFALFHSSAYADNEEKKVARRKNIGFIINNGSAKFLAQAIPSLFHEKYKTEHAEGVAELIERYANFSPQALVSYTEAMINRPDRTAVLKSSRCPVLFILGEHDTAIPLQQGLEQCHLPEFSYIYICTDSGHMGMLEEQAFCTKAVIDFLS